MHIRIEPSNGLAIYDQVVRQVKFAIARSVMREGELAPSVRELARDLAINPNTVTRAYQLLQVDGVLESIRGKGLAVKKGATAKCRKERLELVRSRLRDVLSEAHQSGLGIEDVEALIQSELKVSLLQEGSA